MLGFISWLFVNAVASLMFWVVIYLKLSIKKKAFNNSGINIIAWYAYIFGSYLMFYSKQKKTILSTQCWLFSELLLSPKVSASKACVTWLFLIGRRGQVFGLELGWRARISPLHNWNKAQFRRVARVQPTNFPVKLSPLGWSVGQLDTRAGIHWLRFCPSHLFDSHTVQIAPILADVR